MVKVPLDLRSLDVCPIPKKGLITDTGNYRPISLTSVPGKVHHEGLGGQFPGDKQPHQHVKTQFSSGKFCVTNLLDFTTTCSVSVTIQGHGCSLSRLL